MRIALKEFINKIFNKIKWDLCNLQTVCKYKNFDLQLTTHNSLAKALAFTLAETLVVMGIIGVVAALTIPNLNQSTGDREKVARLKKAYANLEDAYGRATAVYGPIEEWVVNDTEQEDRQKRASERFAEFMKISKTCEDSKDCLFIVEEDDVTGITGLSYILADGTSFAVGELFTDYSTSIINGPNTIAYLVVDIDGPKGKNEFGKDIFIFAIYKDGLFPNLGNQENNEILREQDISDENFGTFGATEWVIKNGNMDYLKCPDELDWDTKTSCK